MAWREEQIATERRGMKIIGERTSCKKGRPGDERHFKKKDATARLFWL
jgi:hypothetical protein